MLVLATQAPSASPGSGTGTEVHLTVATPSGASEATVSVGENATAFDVLNRSHTVEYQTYESGLFITGIGGTAQNDTHSWVYLVNGSPPEVAADRLEVSSGTNVTFRFMSNDDARALFE